MLQKTSEQQLISQQINLLRASFNSGRTRPLEYRQQQLMGLSRFLEERELEIEKALHEDMGRPALEAFTGDIISLNAELTLTRKKLSSWIKPERVSTALAAQPAKSLIYREPYGVVLIIAPWNYPVQLALCPLIGALAAGNCAVIKPSELAPATSKLLANLLPKYVDPECLQIIEGGITETTALLAEHFDYIFYTGNGRVGRIVMEAAAKHLTPITLELGGKSPCIVDKNIDLEVTARRILFGKFYNAGQTCVSPDYILVNEKIEEQLLDKLKQILLEFYGKNPQKSADFGRIINTTHHQRLLKLMHSGGEIFVGGEADENERYIAPTLLRNIPTGTAIMQEEIFGPLLPVLKVKNIDEAISFINSKPKPLALYLFSNDKEVQNKVLEQTSSGGVCINHTTLQLVVPTLPFGGIGASGMGAYHGKTSFETFTHKKSVLIKPFKFDISLIYPPYKKSAKKWLRWLI